MAQSQLASSTRTTKSVGLGRIRPRAVSPPDSDLQRQPPEVTSASPGHPDHCHDSDPGVAIGDVLDRSLHAAAAHFTGGLAPAALGAAYLDWALHLACAPGKRMQLVSKAARKAARLANYSCRCVSRSESAAAPCIEPLPQDKRFAGAAWQRWPYNLTYQSFLLQQQWWHNATTGVRGVTAQHEAMVEFASRQLLDMVSPSNFLISNPELLQHTMAKAGANLWAGLQNLQEDWLRILSRKRPIGTENFEVGRDVGLTPGQVIYRNRLIELIQYSPATDQVHFEPILIAPAWIMKYYILDLSAENSLVKYLTQQGFTVFMISWKNPTAEDRDLGMEDYRTLGIMAALNAVSEIAPNRKIHAAGYCLGGTLLAIAAAAMARDGDDRLKSITMLASQTDFTEAGELMLFINESQITFLEDMMWEQGVLDTKHMAGAFHMLRSNDLIWSYMVRNYLMGERESLVDIMAWSSDATRMPYRMHSEYLRRLFLNNDLADGRFLVGGKPIALTDIRAPIFAVGTRRDHVAPWRSTFKINILTNTEVTYLLTTGGHNAGIVSPPEHDGRSFQVMTKLADGHYVDPDTWAEQAPRREGSWWPEWADWLRQHSGPQVAPPSIGATAYPPICSAPGTYVLED